MSTKGSRGRVGGRWAFAFVTGAGLLLSTMTAGPAAARPANEGTAGHAPATPAAPVALSAPTAIVTATPLAAWPQGWPVAPAAPQLGQPKAAPAYPRLDGGLNRALQASEPVAGAERLGYRVRDGRIQVNIVVEDGEQERVIAWLEAQGAAYLSSAFDIVQAHVRPETLRTLDLLPGVVAVRMPTYLVAGPQPERPPHAPKLSTGASVTEGLAAMNAPAWHGAGYTGQGVRVGVIDSGFGDYHQLLGTELPGEVELWQCPSCQLVPGDNHGTACAEIIADVVPNAALYLAQVSTKVDNVNAAQWLQSHGVGVISESLGFRNGPGDGTGDVQAAIGSFVNAGGVFAASAGNYGVEHWQSPWADVNGNNYLDVTATSECIYLSVDGVNPALIPTGIEIKAELIWNQWSSPQTNLDFGLYYQEFLNAEFHNATWSTNPQSGMPGELPVEQISYVTPLAGYYCLAVLGVSGPGTVDVEVFVPVHGIQLVPQVAAGSIVAPGDTPYALTVGALDAAEPYPLEPYSSAGPTNGPGGSLAGGIIKPDISGFANVSTASYGPRSGGSSFSGTSAACPHVAGAAALVWSAYPGYTNAQVRQLLESRVVDMGPPGKDNDYGFGRLWLGNPPGAAPVANFTWSPASPTAGQPVQLTDTSTGPPTSWAWDFGDGGSSTQRNPSHVFAAAGTYQVRLTATNASGSHQATKSVTVSAAGTPPVANFTWSPASPTAGQPVQLTDTSTGSPTSWAWDFGDGTSSTQRNPSHVFAAAGSYQVRLTATNASGSHQATKSVTVSPAGTPPVANFTWSPSSPTAGQAVQLTDTSTGSPTSWAWDFGDGTSSTQRNPSHVFAAAGSYQVRLTATNASGSHQATKSVTVAPASGGDGEPVFVPAGAHAAGAAGTFFVTDLRVFNPGDGSVIADLYFTPSGGGQRLHASRTLAPQEVLFLPDVVLGTFGLASGVGALEARPSGGEVMVASRTYNTAPSGTYGQFIDGRPASEAVGLGTTLHLLQLAKSSLLRANAGLCETTGNPATVRFRMYDDRGAELGAKSYELAGYGFRQVNDVFNDLGVAARANVRVTVEVTAGGGKILAYASVVDNLSSDQICVPAQVAPSGGEALFVAAGASAAGAQGSLWKTDIRVANLAGASRTVRVSLLPSGQSNSSPPSATFTLGDGQLLALDDVVGVTFGRSGSAGLMVDTVPPGQGGLIATSRTYNQSPSGTFGQFIPALPASRGVSQADGRAIALQVDRSPDFRANVGFVNASGGTGAVTVELIAGDGVPLASQSYTLKPYSPFQVNDVFNAFGVAWRDNARVDFRVNGEGQVIGYASVIDNRSNDPVCVMAKRPPVGGAAPEQPDLTPTTPAGWSGPIVVSTVAGTTTDSAPFGGQPAYVDVAVRNTGGAAAGAFSVQLRVDGAVAQTWAVPSLAAGATWTRLDHPLTLAAGSHTLGLVVDSANTVTESDESDNSFSRTLTWQSPSLPDLTPAILNPYTSPVVVANAAGATSTASQLQAGPTYFSWFVANFGAAATPGPFSSGLYVNGTLYYSCEFTDPLAAGFGTGCADAVLDMPAGTYTVSTTVDYENAIPESDETNNSWSVQLTWE